MHCQRDSTVNKNTERKLSICNWAAWCFIEFSEQSFEENYHNQKVKVIFWVVYCRIPKVMPIHTPPAKITALRELIFLPSSWTPKVTALRKVATLWRGHEKVKLPDLKRNAVRATWLQDWTTWRIIWYFISNLTEVFVKLWFISCISLAAESNDML